MQRIVRCQAAIVQNDHLLLSKSNDRVSGKTFWLIPGGGQESNETEEECIAREVCEETHLSVEVKDLLLDEQAPADGTYQRLKTYRCRILSGEARPGIEPEADVEITICEIGWFDMHNPATWDRLVLNDSITSPVVRYRGKDIEQSADLTSYYERSYPHRASANL